MAAARNKNSSIRGTNFLITLSNRSPDACTFAGPVEVTVTDAGDSAVTFPGGRSSETGLAVTALPGDDRGAHVRVLMASRTPGVPRLRRECLAVPVGTHLSVSWPGAEGSVAVAAPDTYGFHLCNVEVSAFTDPWPSW